MFYVLFKTTLQYCKSAMFSVSGLEYLQCGKLCNRLPNMFQLFILNIHLCC